MEDHWLFYVSEGYDKPYQFERECETRAELMVVLGTQLVIGAHASERGYLALRSVQHRRFPTLPRTERERMPYYVRIRV